MRLARQRGAHDERAGGALFERKPEAAQEIADSLRKEMLVADLEATGLPGVTDLAKQRAEARGHEVERTQAGPLLQEDASQSVGIERLDGLKNMGSVLG